MKVTISAALYNVASYVEDCVRSLYGQTMDDLEILLVDDGSSDGSIDIALRVLEDYPDRKPQVRVIRHEQNQGTSATKRDAILNAKGEYVIVIDGDDWVDTRMVEKLYDKAQETAADMVFCDYWRVRGDEKWTDSLVRYGVIGDGDNVRNNIIDRRIPPYNVLKLIRKSIFTDNPVVWPQRCFGEDTVISVVSAYYARRIAHVREPLYYRINSNSICHREMTEQHCMRVYNEFMQNINITIDFLVREGVAEKYGRGIIINKIRTKNRLLPVTRKRKYRKLWWHTYPEINRILLFGNKYYRPSYREWVFVAAVMLGLYPANRERLRSPRLKLSQEWY